MRRAVPVVLLASCSGATGESPHGPSFEVHRVEVGHTTSDVALVDGDLDGHLDVWTSGEGRITVLLGDGAGGLVPHEVVDAGERPVDLAVGDVDLDGRPDVVVANHETRYVTLLLQGSEGFESGIRREMPLDLSPHPHAVALADLDKDGRLDLLVDDRDRERLLLLRGTSEGGFVDTAIPLPVGGDPYRGMSVADLDGDGHLDVITPNPREVATRFGDSGGGFVAGPDLASTEVAPFSVAVGDFDGDGLADIATGSGEGQGAVRIWRGAPGRRFVESPASPVDIATGPTALTAADIDADGRDDLVVTSWVDGELTILLGGGEPRITLPLPDRPWNPAAGDLNGDGRVDLVLASSESPEIFVLIARAPSPP